MAESEAHNENLLLAQFLVDEIHGFFGDLKRKLDDYASTRVLPSQPAGQKSAEPGKRKRKSPAVPRKLTLFNLFVRETIAKTRASGAHPPEGEKEGGWHMAQASKKWKGMSAEERTEYGKRKAEELQKLNDSIMAANGITEPAGEAATPASKAKKQKKAAEAETPKEPAAAVAAQKSPLPPVAAPVPAAAAAEPAVASPEKKKKKKKKKVSEAAAE